jgi:hypothetical protein
MSLSSSSLSILGAAAVTLVTLGACTNPVILATGGSGSGAGPTTGSAHTSSSGTGASPGTGGGKSCADVGGTCTAGTTCAGDTPASTEACPSGEVCCVPQNDCTAAGGECLFSGESCNGTTGPAGSCGASVGAFCCVPTTSCDHPCAVEDLGKTQCANDHIQTCTVVGSCSVWVITSECPSQMGCDSTADACVPPSNTCAPGGDQAIQCGCGCGPSGEVECTGGLPPSCTTDSDCGATCAGFVCHASTCVPWVCNPGSDQMCNESTSMSALAGACNTDGTCTCKAGFTLEGDGKCG